MEHFEIKITGTQHHTRRGVLFSPHGPFPFRSDPDLLWEPSRPGAAEHLIRNSPFRKNGRRCGK